MNKLDFSVNKNTWKVKLPTALGGVYKTAETWIINTNEESVSHSGNTVMVISLKSSDQTRSMVNQAGRLSNPVRTGCVQRYCSTPSKI